MPKLSWRAWRRFFFLSPVAAAFAVFAVFLEGAALAILELEIKASFEELCVGRRGVKGSDGAKKAGFGNFLVAIFFARAARRLSLPQLFESSISSSNLHQDVWQGQG
jgi:hypothetical protein